jgi:uncharacterized protein (DUF305 family)
MIEHHEGAVAIGQEEIASGHLPDLIAVAEKVVITQQAEIIEMEKLLDEK